MQIERLRLVNFRQHEDTEIVFGAGLTGIIGPNGSGKTTLLEAIAWAIYGAPAARGTRDSIRRRGAGARVPVRVELEFALGAHRYRLNRTLGNAELFQDGDPAPIASSLAAVTEKSRRMLGMTREEFFNTYFTGQKELAVMAAMKPGERAQFLSRVLGYDRLRSAQERLRESRTALRARLQALEGSLPDPTELDDEEQRVSLRQAQAQAAVGASTAGLAAATRKLEEVRPRWTAMQRLQEAMQNLEGDLRLADHKVLAAREKFLGLDRQLLEASEARSRLESLAPRIAPLEGLRAERQALDGQAEAHSARERLVAQLEEIRTQLVALDARITRLPTADVLDAARVRREELRRALAAELEQVEDRRTAWVRDAQDARTKRETLVDQYKELKEQHQRIVAAGPQGVCPTCARPLGAEFQNVLGVLERQLQDVLFNGQFYKQRIEQLAPEPADLQERERKRAQLDREVAEATARSGHLEAQAQEGPALLAERGRLVSRIEELERRIAQSAAGYDRDRHHEVRRLLEELEPLALQAERLRAMADRAEALVREAEAAERELSELEAVARGLRERMAGLGYTEAGFLEARRDHATAENAQRMAELAVVRARAEAEAAEEAKRGVARRREERVVRERELRRTEMDLSLHNELDRALSELRTDLNAQLRPDLSDLASAFLRDLTRGRYTELELDEDYAATLLDGGEVKPVISGGEEDVANLALRLAISQMIAERAGQPLSLLVLDEIFGSLDEEHRVAVVDLLRSLADRFPQVILITHIESVREGLDRVLRVDFDVERGAARVRDEAAGGVDGLAA